MLERSTFRATLKAIRTNGMIASATNDINAQLTIALSVADEMRTAVEVTDAMIADLRRSLNSITWAVDGLLNHSGAIRRTA